jgi:hypothetical protein
MKVISLADLQQGFSYLVSNPSFLLRSIVNVTRMRFGVPMDAVQWLLGKVARGKLPKDLQLAAVSPGLRASATVNVMGAAMFVSAVVSVEQVQLASDSARVSVRLRDLQIKPPADSPIAGMLAMMDLSKPGDMLGFMPMKPPMILSASGDLFVLELMKLPKLANNPRAAKIVAALSEILVVRELQTEDDLLVLGLRAIPQGLMAAISHLRS